MELLPAGQVVPKDLLDAQAVWLPDQASPFGGREIPPYRAVLLHDRDDHPAAPHGHGYRVQLVTGKDGPAGAVQLLALVGRRDGQSLEDAFRHWDAHIPLAVQIHHKARRYRQFRFIQKLTDHAPDYFGFAVLDFTDIDSLRTELYRNKQDFVTISEDVAKFIGQTIVMVGSERVA